MREILFRGKTEKGEWVYGDLIHPDLYGNGYAIEDFTNEKNNCFDVAPESVSEFTGLKDKNGKRIFEGDVVKVESYGYCPLTYVGKVIFKDGCYCIEHMMGGEWMSYHRIGSTERWQDMGASGIITYSYQVIGNIHDNPELIGGGDNA